MRAGALFGVAVGALLAAGAVGLHNDPGTEGARDRIARLIGQLGDKDFKKRDAAGKELEAIGAPALDALRKAASHDDPEVRRRAGRILQAVTGRMPAEVQFDSAVFSTDLPLAESKKAVHRVALRCRLADGGTCTLILDPNAPKLNEFGDPVAGGKPSPLVTLDCTLKLVKKDEGRQLYELRGPKIVSRLSLAAYKDLTPWGDGRLLVHGKGAEIKYAIDLQRPEVRTKPCHPGCFPAGTMVRVPDGIKPIERLREGDLVTTVDAEGKPSSAKVTGVFVTRNRILEVRVEGGKLTTTETQPVGLEGGGFRPAGELKAGDRIWRWVGGKRRAAAVLGVSPADRAAEVFNLVLGEPTGFIARDFVVRSKPPAAEPRNVVEAVAPSIHGQR